MSAIAYITDSRMLDLHRLHSSRTMNFWRLSRNVSFTNFSAGDLVFFISKDKKFMRGKEKGIVGFGKAVSVEVASAGTMWKRHGVENGYGSLAEFKEAIIRVSKNGELPEKISAIYLRDITFFQSPVYLSECGMDVSFRLESFTYLKDEVVLKLLEYGREALDIWSSSDEQLTMISKEMLRVKISMVHDCFGDPEYDGKFLRRTKRKLKKYIEQYPDYGFVGSSATDIYKITDDGIEILMYYEKGIDSRVLLGQAQYYRRYGARHGLDKLGFGLYKADFAALLNK